MQVVIIAGGLGTRLGQLTANQPKSLIQILGKPFIDYHLDLFLTKYPNRQGLRDGVLPASPLISSKRQGNEVESVNTPTGKVVGSLLKKGSVTDVVLCLGH